MNDPSVRTRRLLVLCLGVLLLCPCLYGQQRPEAGDKPGHRYGAREARQKPRGAVRLATYNVLNLFDPFDDPSLSGEFDDIQFPTPEDRLRNIAKTIRTIDADILALQEIESKEALEWFRDEYLQDMGYDHVSSFDVGYYRGVECAVMSRFPFTEQRVCPQAPLDELPRAGIGWTINPPGVRYGFQRCPLLVSVQVDDDYQLTLICVHHKSGRDYDYQREGEALRLSQIIDEIQRAEPSRNIALLGDFNAAPWDKSTRTYLAAGLIDVMDFRCTDKRQPECAQFKTHESGRVIDYILLNSAAHRELVIGSPFVYGTLHPGDKHNWRVDPKPPGYASDHYPVVIDLLPEDRL